MNVKQFESVVTEASHGPKHPNPPKCRKELQHQKVKSATDASAPRAVTQNQSYTQVKECVEMKFDHRLFVFCIASVNLHHTAYRLKKGKAILVIMRLICF